MTTKVDAKSRNPYDKAAPKVFDRLKYRRSIKITLWVLVASTIFIALFETRPPAALSESASADQFSAARAKTHLRLIARQPHFEGTHENQLVRDYLKEALSNLGGKVHLENTTGIYRSGRYIYAGRAENIVATFPGTSSSRAVMLVAHYDSVQYGPGAADDGAGVVAILETMRAMRNGSRLKNDVVVVYTDGEEQGPIGATGYVFDHPDLAKRFGVVMNFEARGSSGPALMFETSERSGWLIREISRAPAPHAITSSLMPICYKQMPNDTDLTALKTAGMQGLNFAFTNNSTNYHTSLDTPENLDASSLQHMGAIALALTRHFGNLDLSDVRDLDRVYFNWLGTRLVQYDRAVIWVVLVASCGLLFAVVATGRRRRGVTTGRTMGGFVAFLVILLAALGGGFFTWWIIGLSTPRSLLNYDTTSNSLFAVGLVGVGAAAAIAAHTWLARKLGLYNLAIGELCAVLCATITVSVCQPGASYVLQWPLLFALVGLMGSLFSRTLWAATMCGFFATAPAALLFPPLIYLVFANFGLGFVFVSSVAIFLVLFLAVGTPMFVHISEPLRWFIPILLVVSLAAIVTGRNLAKFTDRHPSHNTIMYSLNADEGKAKWLSGDDAPDAWTSQFLASHFTKEREPLFALGSENTYLSAEAPLLPLEPPVAMLISDEKKDGNRRMKFRLSSPRQANVLVMRFPRETAISAFAWNGRWQEVMPDPASNTQWYLRYSNPEPEGVELELIVGSTHPLECWLGDRSLGLPQIPGRRYELRPRHMISGAGGDVAAVGRHYTF
jgi:hypothetical protein